MAARINLYNYRGQQVYWAKLRCYILGVSAILLAWLINIGLYFYYQVKIIQQQSINQNSQMQIEALTAKLQTVVRFNRQVDIIAKKIDLLKQIDRNRDSLLALFQSLGQITPDHLYFNLIRCQEHKIEFNGIASSPLYIADFLQALRAESKIFNTPLLQASILAEDKSYNFVITADLESNFRAKVKSYD